MARMKYTTMASDGTCSIHERDIEDVANLARELERQGLILVSTETQTARRSFSLRGEIPPRAITAFLRELSLILHSNLPLAEALDLSAQDVDSRLAEAIRTLRRDVVAGSGFAQSLERLPNVFSPDIVAMAQVAEATGEYDSAFQALAAERNRSHALLDKVSAALRYPLFLTCAAIFVLFFFMLHVIPQFSGLFAGQKQKPHGLSAAVFGLSDWLVANQQMLTFIAIAVFSAGLLSWRAPVTKALLLRGFASLPVIGSLLMMRRSALLLSNLGVLLVQGVPLIEALKVLENLVSADAKPAFSRVQDVVRQGGRLQDGLLAGDILPPLAVRMLKIGEETGELARTASEAGELYMEKLEKRLEQVTAFIGPIAILFIAGMIGTIMVAVMMAVISVNDLAL